MNKTPLAILAAAALIVGGCSHKATYQSIKPMPSGIDLKNLTDATVAASFNKSDFGDKLTMTVYSEDLYDAVEISRLKAGDTLTYSGKPIVVSKIEKHDNFITVNDGIEEGGANLQAAEGGTYRAMQLDDHSVYTKVGKVTLPVAEGVALIDCRDMPDEPSDTIRTGVADYMRQLSRGDFFNLNTQVRIEGGKVTCVTRKWIP